MYILYVCLINSSQLPILAAMLPKCRQASISLLSAKHIRTTCSTTSNSAPTQATLPPDVGITRDLSPSDLASLPAKTLRSHLKFYKLSPVGNKMTLANRLYQFLHPTVSPANNTSSTSIDMACSPSSTISVPRPVMEQLSAFFQQFNNAIPTTTMDTSGNNQPSTVNAIPDVDETLSVASEQLVAHTG